MYLFRNVGKLVRSHTSHKQTTILQNRGVGIILKKNRYTKIKGMFVVGVKYLII